jgi:two-component system sensor histidine kinase KdpD
VLALAGGLVSILLITAVCFAIGDIPITIPALLLLVPIGIAGMTGGAFVAVAVAVVAALAYALAFLPPIGHVRVGLTEDVVVLITFVAVAIGVAVLSDRRRGRGELLDHQRAILLRSVSHDLRSPLTTIRSVSSDLLEEQRYDSTTRSELLGMVVDESDRLDRIVGNLLSASRIEAGAFEPDQAAHDLAELAATCCSRFNRVDGHHAAVTCTIEPDRFPAFVDPVQFDQALANLVENARRAAPAHTTVVISARRVGDQQIEVRVDDEGPGFAVDELDHVFEPFWSRNSSTGLGLSVCKSIIEAHGGTIRANNHPDGGASMTFTVPSADAQARLSRPAPASHRSG